MATLSTLASKITQIADDANESLETSIKDTALLKSGGVMSGHIRFSGDIGYLECLNTDGYFEASGAPWGSGARITLFGKDNAEDGAFYIVSQNETDTTTLYGNPSGELKWAGNKVHTDGTYSGVSFLKPNETVTYGWNGLQYFNKRLTAGTTPADNYAPVEDWHHVIRMNHANNAGYYVDIACNFHDDRIHTRRVVSGNCPSGWCEIPVLKTYYRSGTSWYRKYGDGFIEQGGRFTYSITNGGHTQLTFPTPFTSTNYQVMGSGYRSDSSPWQGFATFRDFNTSYCNVAFWDDTTSNPAIINWYACGY